MLTVHTPAARANDPQSSHDAADQHTRTGDRAFQQRMTAEAVKRHPGLTSLELSKKSGIDRHLLGRRLSECAVGGSIRRGPMRRCTASPRAIECVTWWPPEAAIQLELVK